MQQAPKPRKSFRMGQYVMDTRNGIIYGVGWISKDGLRVVAPDGSKHDVTWPDAYRYYNIM